MVRRVWLSEVRESATSREVELSTVDNCASNAVAVSAHELRE